MRRHLNEGPGQGLSQRLARIGLHDHACLVLDSEDQRLEIASAFLQIGLERGERSIYVADENSAGRIMPYLRAGETDPGRALASGALVITTDGGTCLRSGSSVPADVLSSLEAQVQAAVADGFRALRVVADATWALGRTAKIELLVEYEERLKRTFRDHPVAALWLYDPWRCSPGLLRAFLRMHPLVVVRGEVHRNCLFVPAARRDEGRARHEEWQPTLDAIVERARAEDGLARRMEALHVSLDGGAHGLWAWDLESDRVSLDPQFAEVPGIEPSRLAVTLSEWEQVVHPDALGQLWKTVQDHVEGHTQRLDDECRMRDRSGQWRWVHLRGRAVRRDAAGRPVRIAGTLTDVTDAHAARERLRSAEQLALAGRLAASIARGIDGPLADLTAGLGFASELLQRAVAAQPPSAADLARVVELVEETRRGAARVRDVVEELPSVVSACADGEAVPCDVRRELAEAVRAARAEVERRARLTEALPETLPRVLARRDSLEKVFRSLLFNAAQAVPEGAPDDHEVRVAAHARGDQLVVEVADTGVGMGPQVCERAFDLARAAPAAASAGLGVGLFLSRALIERSGGRLEVESEPGRGTTVRVVMPAVPAASAEGHSRHAESSAEARRRVLIIDDEELLAGSFARALAADHEVTALSSAQEALRRIESGESWDVILCDLQTSEVDGMEFYERLNRARPDLAARLGFITEGPWPPEVRTFLACNTWPTIEKPADPEGVRAIVARMALQ